MAKKRPGELNFASNGTGTVSHLALELFKQRTGIAVQHIPDKGGPPAVADLIGGQVSALITSTPNTLPQARAGRLRPLGVTTLKRIVLLPEVPTLDEAGVRGFEALVWFGALVPAGTSRDIVDRLNAGINKALTLADVIKRLAAEGATPLGGTAEQCSTYLKSDYDRWDGVVRNAGIERQ
jgi:tripartite-type tricarboxylate transporter receptor subunit TctC